MKIRLTSVRDRRRQGRCLPRLNENRARPEDAGDRQGKHEICAVMRRGSREPWDRRSSQKADGRRGDQLETGWSGFDRRGGRNGSD